MAKGAATETTLGRLHSRLASVFDKVLVRYENSLDRQIEANDPDRAAEFKDKLEEELLDAAISELAEPSPAMLSAISKFLKDNDIGLDSEEVDKLSATERRLEDKRKLRKAAGLKVVDIGYASDGS